jgi:hypothetical protein
MKLTLCLGLVFGFAGLAQAQSASLYRVNVPFDFTVGKKLYRAGEYEISTGGLSMSRERLTIGRPDGKERSLVAVTPNENIYNVEKSIVSALVFNLYENQYFLTEVKTSQLSVQLPKSKIESKLAKNPKRVEVALTR